MVTNMIEEESVFESTLTDTDNEVVLSVQGVSKKFCRDLKKSLFYGVQDIASELTGLRSNSKQLRPKEFWALENVNLELRRGEALGLVGPNGSGKTTLMRIIAGLIKPDTGVLKVRGRLAPLIALGAGFNPVLTGRENIYTNMSILGVSKKEINYRLQDVIDFAEIGDAIDAPVQTYSSGMAARLGFSTAIHTEPDILLIDEVLAVGDVRFKGKCTRRLAELREQGTSFIFVSHNSMAVMSVCSHAVYLKKGNLIASSDPETIISRYEEDLFLGNAASLSQSVFVPKRNSNSNSSGLDITSITFTDKDNNTLETIRSGIPTNLHIDFTAHDYFKNVSIRIRIDELGKENKTVLLLSGLTDKKTFNVLPGKNRICVQMPYLGLAPGLYSINANVRKDSHYIFDTVESFRFVVKGDISLTKCIFYQPRSWKLESNL